MRLNLQAQPFNDVVDWNDHGLEEALNYILFHLMGMFGEKMAAKQKHHPCGESMRQCLSFSKPVCARADSFKFISSHALKSLSVSNWPTGIIRCRISGLRLAHMTINNVHKLLRFTQAITQTEPLPAIAT
ncbi:MAG: hypothetical protein PHR16_00370 [Methylovulum sp.]|nr:hypothetical protein [Methylovulum sp.]